MNQRPNVLLFLMDACQAAALEKDSGCLTPNFDRLAEQGLHFQRAYCPSPTCSPSRASLMTGLLPHNHGVLEVEHGRDDDQCVLRAEKPHWAQRLREAKYSTGYFGKWHIERTHDLAQFGWEASHAKGARHHANLGKGIEPGAQTVELIPEFTRYHSGPEGYNDILHYGVSKDLVAERYPHFTTTQTIDYIADVSTSDNPWCACASFSEPNEALIASEEVFRLYDPEKIDLPANRNDAFKNSPGLYRRQKKIGESLSDDEWRMARACYYSRITELDIQFGRILNALEESGQIDNTIIIVTADHGRYVGGHGFDAHNFGAFEEIYRIPLIISGPDVAKNAETGALVGLHDLCPTLLEMTGAEMISVPDSKSFASVLKGDAQVSRRGAYSEYHGTRFPLAQRIWWEQDYKFVFNGFDFDELYYLPTDPDELNNLANDPAQEERLKRMMKEVWREIKETGDRTIEETHYFSMRMGLVGPDCS